MDDGDISSPANAPGVWVVRLCVEKVISMAIANRPTNFFVMKSGSTSFFVDSFVEVAVAVAIVVSGGSGDNKDGRQEGGTVGRTVHLIDA